MKFPEFSPIVAKKNLKLHCCDRCNRAEWVEQKTTASFCRCGTRRRPPTRLELDQFKQQLLAAAAAAPPAPQEGGEA